jgi:hypothetical protein
LWRPVTYLLDMDGKIVHQWKLAGNPGGYARLLPNGNLLAATSTEGGPPFKGGAGGGQFQELDWDGTVVWEYRDDWQHHDFRRLRNGNTLYAAWEMMPAERAAKVRGGIPGTEGDAGIVNDCLYEVNPAGEKVWEWHAHSMDVENHPLHSLCPRRVFAWCNTCSELDNGDILISLRQINTCAIIDKKTGKFSWLRRDDEWGHQHDVQILPNGNMMMFANGMNNTAAHSHSYITEFNYQTGETMWEYKDNPRTYFYSPHISGAERLASGNTLICEGSFGRIFEVTPEKQIVWEFINPDFDRMFMGDDVNWVFRAFRYGEDSPEIAGRLKL